MDEVRRYVNLAYIFAGMILAWLFVNLTKFALGMLVIPDHRFMGEYVTTSTLVGLALAVIVAVLLWKNAKVYNWSLNVAYEMKKVTWPTLDETKYAMKVVLATSIIVALILFCFDIVAKELTGFIFGLK